MFVEKNTFGQVPFCSSAPISVPGAPPPSLATDSQPAVENPGVEICPPPCVAVALVSTFQPVEAPRLATAVDPVAGSAKVWVALAGAVGVLCSADKAGMVPIPAATTIAAPMTRLANDIRFMSNSLVDGPGPCQPGYPTSAKGTRPG